MTAAQARAVSASIRLYTATAADSEAGAAALSDVGYAFAPRVDSSDGGERIFFDCADLGQLYPYGESAIAQAVQAHAARLGLGARVAIASSKGIARVATRARELAVVPAGIAGARAFMAPIPVDLLTDDVELRAAFRRWGTRTAGAIAVLPADAVALRLGPRGADVARLACGKDDEPFVPRLPPDALEEAVELDYPVYDIEALAFVLRGLLDRALARLAGRSLACAGMALRLSLDPRGLDVRTVSLAAPTREAKTLLELVRLDLARRPPDAAVVGARIIVEPARCARRSSICCGRRGPRPSAGDDAGAAGRAGRARKRRRARGRRQLARAGGGRDPLRSAGRAACRRDGGDRGHAAHGPAQAAAGGDRSHHGPRRPHRAAWQRNHRACAGHRRALPPVRRGGGNRRRRQRQPATRTATRPAAGLTNTGTCTPRTAPSIACTATPATAAFTSTATTTSRSRAERGRWLSEKAIVANRACGAERLVGPAQSAGTQLQSRSVVANRACSAVRLAALSLRPH